MPGGELMDGSPLYPDLRGGYKPSFRLGPRFRQEVARYIESRHLEDGGYFFARVPPSSGLDTCFAVKSLSILGAKPGRPETTADFFLNGVKEDRLGGITGIFLAAEVLNELGRMTDEFRDYARPRIMSLQNEAGGFGAYRDIDLEVPSELQDTCRAIRALQIVGADFDTERVARFTSSFLRPDGGYGARGYSTLASTFCAMEIHKLLGEHTGKLTTARGYLRKREENWQVQFIEDLYWLVLGLANLGEKTNVPDKVARFVMMCQRSNGGFSRATIMGIATLEYTYYALSILRQLAVL